MKIHDDSLGKLSMETSDGKIDQDKSKDDGTGDALFQQPEIKKDKHHDKNELNVKVSKPDGPVQCFCSKRWQFVYLAFFAMFWLYVHRVNLSMAIVCMVKPEGQLKDVSKEKADNSTINSNTTKPSDSDLYSKTQIVTVLWSKLRNFSTSNESSHIIQKGSKEERHQEGCQTAFETSAGEYKGTHEEWRNFFYLTAGLNILGAVVFGTFARATTAKWAVAATTIKAKDEDEALT